MAGESAREQARRQREKADRLIESADRWDRGANGEVAVASALAELEGSGWTVLHDLAWPGRKYANIDHVAIGGGRVFVIDAKNWTGDVATSGGVLRQNGRSRAKEVASAAEAASAVAGLIPELSVESVRPVLCLVREDWFSERFGEVLVCSSHNLVAQLRGQPVSTEPWSPGLLDELTEALQAHATAERQARPRGKSPAAKGRGNKPSMKAGWVKMAAAVAAIGVVLAQPVWFTSLVQRASEEFVSVFAPATSDPTPDEVAPSKKRKPANKGRVNQR
ncbi:MAG: nuclease-related domain-containing protein [Nocardioides sp.]|uniref:nuclease-related domain-containing protein n=1 Tax=Nocardioides sp. TaxID=35761 RepID=UPI003265A4B0